MHSEPEPEDYYPDKINEFLKCIADYTRQAYSPKWEEIKQLELKEVRGLLQVDDKKEEIDEKLEAIVKKEDEGIKKIISILEKLKESEELPKVVEKKEEDRP